MIPILYSANTTTFTKNGIGRLPECLSCIVREELNGLYELELTYPTSGRWFSDLVVSNIVFAIPYDGATGGQAFRIYKVSKAMNGRVTAYARHISYQLNWIPVMAFNYSSLSDCLTKLRSNSVYTNPFQFRTDKGTIATGGSFDEPLPCRSCLGGVQGSILQRYGGDYEWDNWTVWLRNRRGADNGVRIVYGKNLTDAAQETNIENTYTGVCPFYKDDNTLVVLQRQYVRASTADNFPFDRVLTVDFTSDYETPPTRTELYNHTVDYITANNIGHPHVSINVSFAALWQTEEYKNIAPLERVQLGDTVTVYFSKLDINEQARVVAYEYNVLLERYNNITIGDAKSSFAKTFVDQGAAIEQTATELKADITRSTDWLTRGNGYVVAVKNTDGSWKELLFLDTPSITTATKVLRINENGIGFSSTGYNGTYAQSWTLDGVLSLGGINNRFGTLALNDTNGRVTAEFSNQGIWLDEYNRDGTRYSSSYVYGDGIQVQAASGSADAMISAGELTVTDSDGTASTLTGSALDVGGVNLSDDTVTATAGDFTTVEATTFSASGSTGVNGTSGKFTFTGGICTDIDSQGSGGVTDTIMADGNILYFEDGILVEVDSE